MILLDAVGWAVAGPLTLVNAMASLELALGAATGTGVPSQADSAGIDLVILVPAHNEQDGIGGMLERLGAELHTDMRILLVADNCTDDTAVIARARGVETIERTDPDRRGKGYALAFGRDHLASAPPAVVIVLDADCMMDRISLRRLGSAAAAAQVPVQAINLLSPDLGAPANVQIGAFAFAVKNQVRQLGLRHLGGPALLNGTGMAFPWPIFADAPLASGHLAEDLELGIVLARRRCFARLEPAARVFSAVSSAAGTMSQRTRWERGFLANALRNALPTVGLGLVRGSWKLFLLGADLLVPPLALLVMITFMGLAATLLLNLVGASAIPALVLGAASGLLGLALVGAWVRCGRTYLSGATLLKLPLYLVWKIPLYAGLILRKPAEWTRTERS